MTGGTDNHLLLVDLPPKGPKGKQVASGRANARACNDDHLGHLFRHAVGHNARLWRRRVPRYRPDEVRQCGIFVTHRKKGDTLARCDDRHKRRNCAVPEEDDMVSAKALSARLFGRTSRTGHHGRREPMRVVYRRDEFSRACTTLYGSRGTTGEVPCHRQGGASRHGRPSPDSALIWQGLQRRTMRERIRSPDQGSQVSSS